MPHRQIGLFGKKVLAMAELIGTTNMKVFDLIPEPPPLYKKYKD
jgi:hypothetical protein